MTAPRTDGSELARRVDERIAEVLAEARREFSPLSRDVAPVLGLLGRFTAGGKRLRAEFCAAGFRSARPGTEAAAVPAVVSAAASLELFHAAALVHDDIIDRSDTRRGAPAAHRALAARHREAGWAGDAERFGQNAAILLGDLLLVWSDELFVEACARSEPEAARAAREEFRRMRTEVTLGQYLDIVEELAWPTVAVEEREERALAVLTAKSARYSVEVPLVLGAMLAGADPQRVHALRGIGLPLGLAFQLRDDVLGVFGEEAVMGKPAGDDLREGKRTLLIAATQARTDPAQQAWLDERLGDPRLDAEQIARMQGRIRDSGALEEIERRIAEQLRVALAAIAAAALDERTEELLRGLAHRTAMREH
ncbi:MAG: polyprenyl synthetase family protein [Pseudoclavibacter sp.]|nr:polyprenyl synthetase family protein [Pseudoclavibacter sp.]